MTVRFSVIDDLGNSRWAESHLEEPLSDWPIILDYLRRLWLIGEDTVLETDFLEPIQKLIEGFKF